MNRRQRPTAPIPAHPAFPHLLLGSLLLTLSPAASLGAQEPTEVISATEVRRIVSTLAADDMQGRASFTPAADRAANFIAAEFRAAGLRPLEAEGGFLQRFPVYEVRAEEVQVAVDGAKLAPEDFVVRSGARAIDLATGDARLIVIGPDEQPQGPLTAALRGSGDRVVLLHPAHRGLLNERLRRFLSSAVRTLDPEATGTLVVAVVDAGSDAEYEVRGATVAEESGLANVVGVVPGRRSDEVVLFSAHYDHVGTGRPDATGDTIYNGANDDASGTAAVILLGRYFASRPTPERTVMFVAFAAEEMGGYGSRYFSSRLDPDEIVAMFNIEMIGKPAVEGPNSAWITGFDRSSFGRILQRAVEGTEYAFHPDPYPDQNLFYRSDNATLARLGVPAHSISTTPIDVDPDYHRPSDEVETLDLPHLTATIRAIAVGAETIVSGEETPTRVDPATVN